MQGQLYDKVRAVTLERSTLLTVFLLAKCNALVEFIPVIERSNTQETDRRVSIPKAVDDWCSSKAPAVGCIELSHSTRDACEWTVKLVAY